MIVMLPFIGGLLKNKNLKHIMLISNAISIVVFILIYVNERSIGASFFAFIILTMIEKVNVSVFNISSQSSFSILFEKERIDSINSLKSVFDNFASLLGPTLGTLIYAKSDLSGIICINIISFIVCFILLMNLNYMHISEPVENERKRKMNICAGLTYLKNNSNIMFIFFTFMVLNFLVAPTENVYAPGIIKVIFGFSDNLFGLTSTAVSIGIIIAGFSMTLFKRKSSILYSFYMQSIIMIVTGIFSLFLRSQPMLFYVIYITLCLLSGYFSTFIINVPMISYFQKNIEINQQTQFFSIMTLSSNIMVPLGTFIAGILCDLMGADVVYLTSGIIMLVYVYIMRWNIKNEEI